MNPVHCICIYMITSYLISFIFMISKINFVLQDLTLLITIFLNLIFLKIKKRYEFSLFNMYICDYLWFNIIMILKKKTNFVQDLDIMDSNFFKLNIFKNKKKIWIKWIIYMTMWLLMIQYLKI